MTNLPISPAFAENNVTVTLQSSDYFAPYAAVTIKSIIDNLSMENNYDIIITTCSMSEENSIMLCNISEEVPNLSIRVVNVKEVYDKNITINEERYSGETIARIFLAEILSGYDKILNIDCDVIVCADVAELYHTDISMYYMGAVPDLHAYINHYSKLPQTYFSENMIYNILQLESISEYYNVGIMLLNLEKIRNSFTSRKIADYIIFNRLRIYEQDAFNHFFRGKVLQIDWSWNFQCDAEWYVENHIKDIYDVSSFNVKYKIAKRHPKIIHYLSSIKPWVNMNARKAVKWWDYAAKSPFFEEIVERKRQQELKDGERLLLEKAVEGSKRILFVCESVYQLLTVLNIKYHLYPEIAADLVLTSTTDFSAYIAKIKKERIFQNIYCSKYSATVDILKLRKTSPNDNIMRSPSQYEHALPIVEQYSDYFMAVASSPYQKILYYQLVTKGSHPNIHFFEDGWVTYIEPIKENTQADILNHSLYKESDRFINNIVEILLYKPELYSNNERFALSIIPKIDKSENDFKTMLYNIFGKYDMPSEKYIFFDECFSSELRASSDIEVLDKIAEKVGKENIVVKLHPRSNIKREFYKAHGYQILADNLVPWEVVAMSAEMDHKVLLSVSSAALLTPSVVFGKKVYAIYLWKVMRFSKRRHICLPNFSRYIEKMNDLINEQKRICFFPNTMNELETMLDYLEGEV